MLICLKNTYFNYLFLKVITMEDNLKELTEQYIELEDNGASEEELNELAHEIDHVVYHSELIILLNKVEEETEIVLLLQTHKIGLEDMEKMLSDVRQSADITATQEKPANKTTMKKNEEVSHNEKTDDKP